MFEGKSDAYLWGIAWDFKGKRLLTTSMKKEVLLWNNNAERINSFK